MLASPVPSVEHCGRPIGDHVREQPHEEADHGIRQQQDRHEADYQENVYFLSPTAQQRERERGAGRNRAKRTNGNERKQANNNNNNNNNNN